MIEENQEMRRSHFRWIVLGIAIVTLGCMAQDGQEDSSKAKSKPAAPSFTLVDLDGNEISLSDYHGKAVVIDFWATWCLPCIYQIPVLNQLWETHRDSGKIAVIGVAVDVEGAKVVAPYVEEKGVTYQILLGDEELARKYGALGFPALAIVAPSGEIAFRHMGPIGLEELQQAVAPFTGG